ncbi:HAD-like protein [Mycena sanguinolenta]|uniref:HAD-like protein n=1 Tax=Mycena sanguinolenta TaxID=230812 RepID=A0A8H6ZAN0_9AGAR|nr:HAD-like protein [Mycena sanguinolenta]
MKDRADFRSMQRDERRMRIKEERRGAGFSSGGTWDQWTSFSPRSTRIPRMPGEIFPRLVYLSAKVHYDLSAADDLGTLNDWEEERKTILRLLARFSDPSTGRAIRWAREIQMLNESGSLFSLPMQEDIPDLTCAPLVEVVSLFDRPPSPVNQPDALQSQTEESDHVVEDWSDSGGGYYEIPDEDSCPVPRISVRKPPPPPQPNFAFPAVQVVYFDVHGTLIDKELGVFQALSPLLSRSPYQFDRSEAVAFYLESEYEIKKRTPAAPYEPFARSIADWPLVSYAQWCLAVLHNNILGLSISAIADVDHDSLHRTSAFAALAPYFDTVFTTDTCAAYKPALAVLEGAVRHYDALGVQRENTCVVSASLLLDLEPARELSVPGIWMRYPQSLAEHVDPWESAFPALGSLHLADLAHHFVNNTPAANRLHEPWTELSVDTTANSWEEDPQALASATGADPRVVDLESPPSSPESEENIWWK